MSESMRVRAYVPWLCAEPRGIYLHRKLRKCQMRRYYRRLRRLHKNIDRSMAQEGRTWRMMTRDELHVYLAHQ